MFRVPRGKPALGADQHANTRTASICRKRKRAACRRMFITKDKRMIRIPLRQQIVQWQQFTNFRQTKNTALFSRLDCIGAHTIPVEFAHLRMLRQHRLQYTCPHLHRLLHHVVQPRLLKGCKQVGELVGFRLGSGLPQAFKVRLLASDRLQFAKPFSVSTVKQQHRLSCRIPQNIQKIMCLIPRCLDGNALRKISFDKKPLGSEIILSHGSPNRFVGTRMPVRTVAGSQCTDGGRRRYQPCFARYPGCAFVPCFRPDQHIPVELEPELPPHGRHRRHPASLRFRTRL